MPIYEYACSECGHRLDKLQKMSDAPLTECPACGEATLAKQVSAAGFRLSGGGWYESDFKTGTKKNLTESASSKSESTCSTGSCGGCGD
ncbi:MAG: zinc ribbon domain-containing protein [Thiotrichales bacterium]|jgi:putative FmdB family regulatory protein|nr:zinc ribbon domain-containing protein [Thiotrichales bacterium]MBT3613774.1 zinc ribbon domain-containing protein [Thiotrichales bacterium]MBT3753214.1 zinc ribbon domain-containing protein [Thiotrichales bacterium]MBT3837881.1 zinc ribbon domain-containing protein [Thiotrichales bacterium]MBT4152066.1 zinc ribbon domain-containing protein [Thiotrichales bacterium]